MEWGLWHCAGNRDQDQPYEKEMQKSKMAVWGGLTNSCEKKRSEKQYPVVDVTGDRRKVQCCKEQYCIGTWNVRSIAFLSFIEPIFAGNVPSVSVIFLRSLVIPILLFSSISLHWSLRKALLSLLAILWNSAFRWVYLSFLLLFSQLFVRPTQTTILIFAFFFLGDDLAPYLLYNVTNLCL